MNEKSVRVNQVAWTELCHWTIIFRSLRSATSATVLIFAFLGLMAMPAGWWVSEMLFSDAQLQNDLQMSEVMQHNRNPHSRVFLATDDAANSVNILGARLSGPRMVFTQLVEPFTHLFSKPINTNLIDGNEPVSPIRRFLYLLTGCTLSIFIWAFVGVGICRVCLLKMTRNEPMNLDEAIEFSVSNYFEAVAAVGIPLITVGVLCLPAFLLGILMGLDIGVFFVGLIWCVVLALAMAMGLLLLGLMFGWPLMVASVACEAQNSFDAMTRAYAYTLQRPVNYAIYLLMAMIFGGFCWFVVANLTDGVINLSYWSTSFGTHLVSGENDRMDVIRGLVPPLELTSNQDATPIPEGVDPQSAGAPATINSTRIVAVEPSMSLSGGQVLIRGWIWLAKSVAASFVYGLFWCLVSGIYLVLRKDVDDTEMDEISIDQQQRTYELPPLKTDENGIPQVQTPTPVAEESADTADQVDGDTD